ncbi:MAG: ribosome maturation factor RimP [Kofleriaceae bacterium]
MSKNPLIQKLITIIEPVCVANQLELVDVRFLLEQGGWTLRVQVDVPVAEITDIAEVPSDRVSLLDCEDLSRELSAVLDVEDPIQQAYSLEISSPGIDRPLRTPAHFAHFAGSEAKITLALPLMVPNKDGTTNERRNFKGLLKSATETHVTIECDGQLFELVIDDIDHAKLVPDWDAVMKGKSGVGAQPLNKPIKPGHRPSQKQKH